MVDIEHSKPKILQRDFEAGEDIVSWFRTNGDSDDIATVGQLPHSLVEGTTVAICTYMRAVSMKRTLDSLARQDMRPAQLIIVDASPTDETENVVRHHECLNKIAENVIYFRVTGGLKGLTRQRNFSLRFVNSDLVVFFDDDVVLESDCLREMTRVHREEGDRVVGVGGTTHDRTDQPTRLWRVRQALRIVPNLRPGTYSSAGMSIPWFVTPSVEKTEGDWLPGYSMMWKTKPARELGFCESFDSYGQSEDLDFSLRMRQHGVLVMAGLAHLQHLPDPSGRPNHFKLGFMAIYNRFFIFKRAFPDRRWSDTCQFIYTWSMDSLLLGRGLFSPRSTMDTIRHLAGRTKGAWFSVLGK